MSGTIELIEHYDVRIRELEAEVERLKAMPTTSMTWGDLSKERQDLSGLEGHEFDNMTTKEQLIYFMQRSETSHAGALRLKARVAELSSCLGCWERLGREIHNGMTGNSDIPARQTHDKIMILLSAADKQTVQQPPPATEGER